VSSLALLLPSFLVSVVARSGWSPALSSLFSGVASSANDDANAGGRSMELSGCIDLSLVVKSASSRWYSSENDGGDDDPDSLVVVQRTGMCDGEYSGAMGARDAIAHGNADEMR